MIWRVLPNHEWVSGKDGWQKPKTIPKELKQGLLEMGN